MGMSFDINSWTKEDFVKWFSENREVCTFLEDELGVLESAYECDKSLNDHFHWKEFYGK